MYKVKGAAALPISMVIVLAISILSLGQATGSRDISHNSVTPGATFSVTVSISVAEDITGLALSESVPNGWTVSPSDNDGATYKSSANEWLWLSASSGSSKNVTYQVTVPGSAAPGQYSLSGSILGAVPSFTASVSGDSSITVTAPQYTLTMAVNGSGATSPSVGTHTYDENTTVTLSATPAPGWEFDRWGGSISSSLNPTTVTMSGNKSVTAYFIELPPVQYTLTMAVSGNGSTSPSVGAHTYDENTTVTLSATPAAGWEFDHWSGSVSGSTNPRTIIMNADKSVTAHFTEIPPQYTLTMAVNGSGATSPSVGTHTYDENTTVTLSATPAPGWEFDRWGGSISSSLNPTTVTMSGNKSVTAYFTELPPEQYTLTMAVSGNGSTSPPVGTHTYDEATSVALSATPATGWQFDYWSGSVSGATNPTTITMSRDKSVTAHYTEIPPTQHALTMTGRGWHLISFPGFISDLCAQDNYSPLCCSLEDDISPRLMSMYSPLQALWVQVSCETARFYPGMGFAIWIDNRQTIDARLVDAATPIEIKVSPGWSLIGAPFSYAVALRDIEVVRGSTRLSLEEAATARWIDEHIFLHDVAAGYQAFSVSDGVLEPWRGYWIQVRETCTFTIPNKQSEGVEYQTLIPITQIQEQGFATPPILLPPLDE